MRGLLHILKESFRLLMERPRVFIPNLFASLLYAFVELILIKLTIDSIGVIHEPAIYSLEEMQVRLLIFLGILAVFPVVGGIDLITYSMYPAIVIDYHEDRNISLWKALKDALSAWRVWLTLGLIFLLFAIFVFLVIGFSIALTFILDNLIFLLIGSLLFISLVILFMIVVFFVMPVGVIEKKSVLESFRESYRLGLQHRGEVILLNAFIILVTIAAFFIGSIFGTEKLGAGITLMAVTLFIIVRIIQSMMYSYIFVVNPYFYVKVARLR